MPIIVATVLVLSFSESGCRRETPIGDAQSAAKGKGDGVLPDTIILASVKSSDILVEVTIVNRGSSPFPLLRWNLPDDGRLTTNLFQVQRDGQVVEYKGLMVKRTVTPSDFVKLRPGREYRANMSLTQGYEVGPKGHYSIRYKASNQSLEGNEVISLASNVVTVEK
jgi:hypothetical protein